MTTGRDFIGPFQLIRLIRAGTTTQVWEAKRNQETERVALKILMQQFRKDKSEIADLKHEANVGSTLGHPNVINIYGFHDEHGLPLLAMQLFNAKNLKIEMRENPDFVSMNLKEIIEKAAEGLAHLHSKDWVHCDVKPDNFLADEQANVKLIDFSIAVRAAKTKGLGSFFGVRSKNIKGTRSYLAPEQIRRKPLDQRPTCMDLDVSFLSCLQRKLLSRRRLPMNS